MTAGKWRQTMAAATMSLGSLVIGISCAWTSRVTENLQKIDNELAMKPLSSDHVSWIVSAPSIGLLVSMLLGSNLCERLGRKKTAIVAACIFIATWLLKLFAINFYILLVAQLLEGIGGGLSSLIIPVYITEMSSNTIRGQLGSFFVFSIKIGYLLGFILALMLPYKVMTGCTLTVPIVQIGGLLMLPETPTYLVRNNRMTDAKRSLIWFRGNDLTIVESELLQLQQFHRKIMQSKLSLGMKDLICDPVNFKGLMISVTMTVIQQTSGMSIMLLYIVRIFQEAKTPLDPLIASIIYACVHLFGCWLSVLIVDRIGRRPLLLMSTAGMAICHGILGTFFTMQNLAFHLINYAWLPLIPVNLYAFSYSSAVGPLASVLSNEVLNPELATISNSILLITFSILSFSFMKLFPLLTKIIGFYNCFFLLSIACCIGFFIVLFFIPETKGKTIETIRQELQKKHTNVNNTIEKRLLN